MRITSGKHRNKVIDTGLKKGASKYRPTSERTRMAVLNMLHHGHFAATDLVEGACLADICCGCGAVGLEALSRGARKVYFVDKDPSQVRLAQSNAAKLGEEARSVFLIADATKRLPISEEVDILFIDPPYMKALIGEILESVRRDLRLSPNHIVVIEADSKDKVMYPDNFVVLQQREYGRTTITIGRF